MLRSLFGGIAAGLLIGIGAILALGNDMIGAFLFAGAFLAVAYIDASLYTDKVGLVADRASLEDVVALPTALVGNWIGASAVGLAVSYAKPEVMTLAQNLCKRKMDLAWGKILILSILCGVLCYVMAKIFHEKRNPIGICFLAPFIVLIPLEHSIADIFYFSAARMFDVKRMLFLTLVVIGNAVGSMLIGLLSSQGGEREQDENMEASNDESH